VQRDEVNDACSRSNQFLSDALKIAAQQEGSEACGGRVVEATLMLYGTSLEAHSHGRVKLLTRHRQ